MAKMAEVCRNVPAGVLNPIWVMLGNTEDVCGEVRTTKSRAELYEARMARNRDAYLGEDRRGVFNSCKGKRTQKKCRSHVDRCGGESFIGACRFSNSHIHVACRVRIY